MSWKVETRDTGANDYHGGDGLLPVNQAKPTNPLFETFIESGVAAGFERTDDLNGYRQEGFAPMDRTTWRARAAELRRAGSDSGSPARP